MQVLILQERSYVFIKVCVYISCGITMKLIRLVLHLYFLAAKGFAVREVFQSALRTAPCPIRRLYRVYINFLYIFPPCKCRTRSTVRR